MRIKYIDGKRLGYAISSGAMEVIRNTDHLNRINVFPVADGDTGSNLSSTMRSILRETVFVDRIDKSFQSLADSAISGARGNSGIIFAQFLNGIAMEINNKEVLSTIAFGESVMKAAVHARAAMMEPVEGTMLTVIREWARAVYDLRMQTEDFAVLLNGAQGAAQKSLAETQNLLKVLREAEVVDSGAKGFVHFTEGIVKLINSGDLRELPLLTINKKTQFKKQDMHKFEFKMPTDRYCTEVLINHKILVDEMNLMEILKGFGSSLILASGAKRTRIHIHTNRPSEFSAIMAEYGEIIEIKAEDMHAQYRAVHKKKNSIAIVTDSVADLPLELIQKHNITVIPQNIEIAGSLYLDKVTIWPEQFETLTERVCEFPKTFQPNIKSFEQTFTFLLSHYKNVIGLFVSSSLSGTYNSAIKAIESLAASDRNRIEIIDTKLNSAAQGLVVLEAAEAIERGKRIDDVLKTVRKSIAGAKIYVSVDTFEFMVRGGRVSPMKGRLARTLNMKPIVSLDENGSGIKLKKSFSRSGNRKAVTEIIKKLDMEEGIKRYALVHCRGESLAKDYSEKIEMLLGKPPEYIMEVSSVVALSAGKNAVGIATICESGERSVKE